MPKVVGKVTDVKKGKGVVKTAHGEYERLNVTVTGEDGQPVVIQRLVKPGNDGSKLIGQRVDVTYVEKQLEREDGETFTVRSADSKNFVLLDVVAKPYQKNGSSSAPTAGSGKSTGSGYNSDGARHGMIVGRAVELAIARKDLDLKGLKAAVNDIVKLTEYVEKGGDTVAPVVSTKAETRSASPFDDE